MDTQEQTDQPEALPESPREGEASVGEPSKLGDEVAAPVPNQPLPFQLSLMAEAPWRSLVLIALALAFGWADWRFAQSWRMPAAVTNDTAPASRAVTIATPCYSFTAASSVQTTSDKSLCDGNYEFGPERIARLRVTALRRGEAPLSLDDIAHGINEKPVTTDVTIGGTPAKQSIYFDAGRRYIDIVITTPPKSYTDKAGVVTGLQLVAPYGDEYGEKAAVDYALQNWQWR